LQINAYTCAAKSRRALGHAALSYRLASATELHPLKSLKQNVIGQMPMAALLNRILAATDLSIAGQQAVMRAGQLATQWQAALRIVHARPDWNLFARWRPASPQAYQLIARRTDEQLGALQAQITAEFGIRARWDSRLGRASDVIAAMAAEFEPSLVVIGARGEHAGEDGSGTGGTAFKLLSRLGYALLLLRNTDTSPYTRSVVTVDGPTPLARRAVLWGTSLVRGGDTCIVHAYRIPYVERMRSPDQADSMSGQELQQSTGAAQEVLAEVRGAADPSTRIETQAVYGDPLVATLREVTQLSAQVVVVGKRNVQTPLVQGGSIGSEAFRIANETPTDVLILS
jgi:nucleotide-binding universal stress UspA family protein